MLVVVLPCLLYVQNNTLYDKKYHTLNNIIIPQTKSKNIIMQNHHTLLCMDKIPAFLE